MFENVNWPNMWAATYETLYMTLISSIFIFVFGLLIGLILFLTGAGQALENKTIVRGISTFVNVFRAIPFVILMMVLIPFTRWLVGTMLGPNAALPALVIGAAPFYARLVEIALREIDKGVLEAAQAMGASLPTIIFKVLIPESLPALISGLTVTMISLVGFTAMAGIIGAGGLGNLAFLEGFQRQRMDVIWVATLIILIIVFIIQFIGDIITKRIDKR